MAKKKSALDAMNEGSFNPKQAAKEAKDSDSNKQTREERLKEERKQKDFRQMVRVSPEVHAMAKKAGALSGKHMQTYIDQLIHKDFKTKYPELWKETMEEIKDKFPEHYAMVMTQAEHW
jgi:predicted HicB family RNase H-like nuclease